MNDMKWTLHDVFDHDEFYHRFYGLPIRTIYGYIYFNYSDRKFYGVLNIVEYNSIRLVPHADLHEKECIQNNFIHDVASGRIETSMANSKDDNMPLVVFTVKGDFVKDIIDLRFNGEYTENEKLYDKIERDYGVSK